LKLGAQKVRAGKIVAHHRHGKGRVSAHRLTVIRPGPIGDTGASAKVADMFIDVTPYVSMLGINIHREYDRRGNTMKAHDESHVQRRTRGRSGGKLVTKE
jgi:hypothetical protein